VETAPPTTTTSTLSAAQELHDTPQPQQQQEQQPTPGKKQAVDKSVRHLESALKKAARENQQVTDKVKKLEAALALAKNQKTATEGLGMRHAQRAERAEEALVDTKRTLTTFRSAAQGRDVRLQRLQEEEKRLKAALAKEQSTRKEEVARAQAASKRLERQVRQLEKEKEGLRVAFKKQGELVEVLRRQMQHVQAAQLLSFTEKDFDRLVRDWQHRGHLHRGRE
jgi:chromosome segregation ATPase